MILLLAVVIFIFVLFSSSSDSRSKTNSTTTAETSHDTSKARGNTLQYLTNNPSEQGLAFAKITNNIVYCCASHAGEFKIGSYEANNEGTYDVWNDDHSISIGTVNPTEKEIYLTPGKVWVKHKSLYPNSRSVPNNFLLKAAHWRWSNDSLFDEETSQVIARFTGDPIAAAAAFICLTYETLMYNKYYQEFHGWK